MNNTKKITVLSSLIVLTFTQPVLADVYIDTSQTEEIKITSVALNLESSITVKEFSDEENLAKVVASNNDFTDDQIFKTTSEYNKLPYNKEVMAAAKKTALNPALIHAVIAAESRHNTRAKSSKGAVGLMQLMPATANRFNVKNKHDPKQNIMAGSKYLRELLTQFNGDLKLSLAAYNAGPGAVIKYQYKIPPYKETQFYVPKVLKYYRQYS